MSAPGVRRLLNPSSWHAEPSAKWYHAAFHSITAMVGAGILALPYSFSYLTWSGGIISLVLCTTVSLYCSHLLAEFHEGPAPDRIRYNRYRDVGRAVLGLLHHFCRFSAPNAFHSLPTPKGPAILYSCRIQGGHLDHCPHPDCSLHRARHSVRLP